MSGTRALLKAIRQVQLTSPLLAKNGVFFVAAPREDDLPFFLNAIYKAGTGTKRLTGKDSLRLYTIEMKAVAEENKRSALDIAGDLADENYRLFGPEDAADGLTARQRLNAKLEPLGWTSTMPIEGTEIGPYKDSIDDKERWHMGHLFRFRIQRLRA